MFAHLSKRNRFRQFYRSTAGSFLIHAALVALVIWRGGDEMAGLLVGNDVPGPGFGTGPTSGPAGGGGGGAERIEYIDISPEAAAEVEEFVVPEPEIPEPEPEVPEPALPALETPAPAPSPAPPAAAAPQPTPGAGSGAGEGTGTGTGTGPGDGPGAGGGSGGGTGGGIGSGEGTGTGGGGGGDGTIRPPVPMSVILPPTPPASVRGRTVELRLAIDARGAVTRADIVTPTGDRNFDNRLRRTALDWRFQPARDPQNRPVAAQVPISFSF